MPVLFFFSLENDQHTNQNAHNGGEGGQLTVIHQNGLGQDLAEDHIQHGAAGEAQAERQTMGPISPSR